MSLYKMPICFKCAHFQQQTPGGTGTCSAYPDGAGIPLAIWRSAADHRQPYDGDHGIVFDPKDERAAAYAELLFAPDGTQEE